MEREEILQKAKRKCSTGEMENTKTNKGNWIALIYTGIIAVAFMIIEGILGHQYLLCLALDKKFEELFYVE